MFCRVPPTRMVFKPTSMFIVLICRATIYRAQARTHKHQLIVCPSFIIHAYISVPASLSLFILACPHFLLDRRLTSLPGPFLSATLPTDPFTITELQNPSYDAFELHKNRRSPDGENQTLWNGRSGWKKKPERVNISQMG